MILKKLIGKLRSMYYSHLDVDTTRRIDRLFTNLSKVFSKDKNIYLTPQNRWTLHDEIVITKDLIYFPIAKCANTSMKFILMDSYGDKGCIIKPSRFSKKQPHRSKYKFTVIRNPYSRLVSSYIYLKNYINSTPELKKFQAHPYQDFKTFVQAIASTPPQKRNEHYAPLSDLLLKRGKWLVDFDNIIKLEQLNEKFEVLKTKFNFKQYRHENKSEKVNYKDFYDLETFNLAKKYNKRDVALLNYEKEEKELYQYLSL